MIAKEPKARVFGIRISQDTECLTSPLAIWEAVRAVARVRPVDIEEARMSVVDFIRKASIRVIAIEPRDADIAIEAHVRCGKGIDKAALNMGDCFAYACTQNRGAHVLFKGNDFIHTDLIDATLT